MKRKVKTMEEAEKLLTLQMHREKFTDNELGMCQAVLEGMIELECEANNVRKIAVLAKWEVLSVQSTLESGHASRVDVCMFMLIKHWLIQLERDYKDHGLEDVGNKMIRDYFQREDLSEKRPKKD